MNSEPRDAAPGRFPGSSSANGLVDWRLYPPLKDSKYTTGPTAGTIYRPQSGPSPSRAPSISKSTETIRPRHLSARDVWPIAAGDNSGGGDAAMLLPFCSGLMEKHSIKVVNKTREEIPNQGEHTHLLFEFRTSGTRFRIVRFEWVCDKDPGPHNLIPVPLLFNSAATVLPSPHWALSPRCLDIGQHHRNYENCDIISRKGSGPAGEILEFAPTDPAGEQYFRLFACELESSISVGSSFGDAGG